MSNQTEYRHRNKKQRMSTKNIIRIYNQLTISMYSTIYLLDLILEWLNAVLIITNYINNK